MKLLRFTFLSLVLLLTFGSYKTMAQALTGTKTVCASGCDYATLTLAVTDLNTNGVGSGGVTFNVSAGYTETLTGRINISATGTSGNQIIFQKNGVGANPILTSYTGTATASNVAPDGMVSITGGDYITIDGINLTESGANTTANTVMEYGYGLFVASATDGAQNNTIKNCTITLNRVQSTAWTVGAGYVGSEGIAAHHTTPGAATTAVVPSAASGSHSNNKFYANTIQNCHTGIALVGYAALSPYTLGDTGNDIGGSILANGNSVLNFGGGAAATTASAGIFVSNQWGVNVSYNTVNNNNGSGVNHPNTLRGIFLNAGSTAASATCNNNSVTIKGGGTNSQVAGIENGFGGLAPASNTISISNNTVSGEYLTATSGVFYGIYNNNSAPTTLNIIGNTIQNINYSALALAGTGVVYGIFISGTPTGTTNQYVRQNTVNNIARFGTAGGTTIGIYSSSAFMTGLTNFFRSNTVSNLSIDGTGTSCIMYGIQTATGTIRCDSNIVYNLSVIKTSGTSALYGIYNIASPTNETYDNNEVYNLSHAGTGITYGIHANTANGVRSIARNKIYSISSNGLTVAGILSALSSPNINSNKIYSIQSNSVGVPTVSGIILSSVGAAGTANIYNNVIGGIYAPNASFTTEAALVRGINITSTTASSFVNIYYNTVYLDATSAGTNFSSAALFVTPSTTGSTTASTAVVNLRNNILINESTPAGTGLTVAYRRGAGTAGFLANYASTSNNNLFYAGTPSATNLIYYDGTSSAQSISDYKTGVFTAGTIAPRDANSVSEAVTFVSTTGSNSQYLELTGSTAYQAESGGVAISGYTDSYAGVNVRTGYPLAAQINGGGSAPDMGAYEGDYTPSDQTGPSISFTNLGNTASTSARTLTASISDPSGVATTGLGLPVLYFKINSGSYTAATGTFVSGTNYSFSFGSGVAVSDVVSYYIVAQDNSASNNISVSPSGGASGLSANPPAASTPPSSPSFYSILPSISGSFDVGATKTSPNYASLTAAMADINAKVLSGAVVLNLDNDYDPSLETFPIVIGENAGSSVTNTLTIKPKSGVTETITGSSSTSILKINGADYIIIDGSNNGTTSKNLTITNTATSAPTAIHIASLGTGLGANYNTIKNCNISTGINSSLGYGISVSGATSGSVGADNDNTSIQNNNITNATIGIYAIGTTATSSGGIDNLSITDNSIDFTSTLNNCQGIKVGYGINSDISRNTINIETSNTFIAGISLETGFTNATVNKNLITKVKSTNASLSSIARGIVVGTAQTGSAITISNNVIYNVLSNWPSSTVGYGHAGIMIGAIGTSTTVTTTTGGVNLYYNSVNLYGNCDRSIASVNYAVFFGSGSSSITCNNNIFSNSTVNINAGATSAKTYAIYSVATNTAYSSLNYNNYYGSGTQGNLGYLGSAKTTLLEWQTASAQDANSLASDPSLNSNTNLIPQTGSPVLAAGTPIVGITTDYIGTTRSVTSPAIGAYENGADGAVPTITYTTLGNTTSTSSRSLTSVSITDVSSINTTAGTKPRIYYKISTNNNAYVGNTSSDNGWKYVESGSSSSPFDFNLDYSLLFGGPVASGTSIQYFVVAQDLASTPNVGIGSGVFNATPTSVALTAGAFPITGTINSYLISPSYTGTYDVGAGAPTYTTLKSFFDALNAGVVTGNITVNITDNCTETATAVLNEISEEPALSNYTITINPSGGAARTITGNIVGAIIKLNGADRVSINGLNTGGNSLAISNTNTAASSSVVWLSSLGTGLGANNNTLNNLTISGGSSSVVYYGVALSGATIASAGADNDNNTISNSIFATSSNAIYVNGTAAVAAGGVNDLLISGNTISCSTSVTATGIQLLNVLNSTVSQNTLDIQQSTFNAPVAISVETGSNNLLLTKNTITRCFYTGSDGYGGRGITVGTGSATSAITISNNVIYGVNGDNYSGFSNSSSAGIFLGTIGGSSTITTVTGGVNIYHNTVNMAGTYTQALACITAALYIGTSVTSIDVRNNIFANSLNNLNVGTGAGSKAYAIFSAYTSSGSAAFSNIDYNDYFVSGSQGVLSRINSSDVTTINAMQTAFGANTASLNLNPGFTSATNLLPVTGAFPNNYMLGTAIGSVTTDIAGVTRSTPPDIGAYEGAEANRWIGTTSNAWATTSNWDNGSVPVGTQNLTIADNALNSATLAGNTAVNNLYIAPGKTLTIGNSTLTINNTIAGTGTISVTNGSISIDGSGAVGTLNFDQTTPGTTNKLANLTYNRSGETITLGNALQISGVVTPTAGTLATGGNLTLISANGADASIAAGSGSYLTGAVTVQRYIPAATSGRKYRYLAAPFASGPSIASSWQQQIHITGAAGVSAPGTPCPTLSAHGNGFDASTYNNGSMLTFNEATATVGSGSSNASGGTIYNNAWTSVANTNSTNLSAGLGYNVFVRGARSQGCGVMDASAPTSPTDVTLSATGTVTTGSFTYTGVTYNASNGDGWNLVGNPYPSAINWDAGSWTKTNVLPTIWIYNPATNGYATYNTSTGGVAGGSNVIPSGAAFFIHATGAPTLALTEAAKTSSYPGTLLLKNKPFDFRLTLSNSNNVKDEHLVALNRTGASDLFDPITDAEKMHNPNNVNIYSIDGANKKYAINALANIQDQEERIVPLGIGAATIGNYQLSIAPVNLPYFYYVFLRDHYLHTEKQVEAGQTLSHSFQVTADSASFRNGRFDLFISNNRPHSTRLGNATAAKFAINVFPNPTLQNVSVTITGEVKNVQALNLYNAMGQLVEQIEHPLATTQIDLGSFPAGMYFIKVISEQVSVETIKLIKN
jgi:hypothetical protein